MSNKEKVTLVEVEERLIKKLDEQRKKLEEQREKAGARFPLVTALFASFGLICLSLGFQKIINKIDFLANNPITLIIFGLALLIVTGTVYKKLN